VSSIFSSRQAPREQIVKFIVLKRGGASSISRDREFTDWNALAGFVDGFIEATA
jgi:menaquinone-dependent protoporphyrinogen oxidase